ncbi:RNA polymerase sigma factor [Maribacter litoralis]|uniref:RNA polymerase sigma-70 factor, ECF subfamily n=1 Tax=Maribacter litoralis TaxID=2059726 RepID=A0A653S6T3_9FLAO|nr:sigma-70 family RNA polymerase sigma factor [Maribacter litoralis]VXB61155.1 RNA polymerase sigma-70 factor, ECF subfamily [Maribacter litoralis]
MEPAKKEKFIRVIDEHKRIIYKIVNSYCPQREDRKDLEQEIIIQLWNAFDNYNPNYKFTTWMYRIALNTAISFYRKEKKWYQRNDFFNDESVFRLEDGSNVEAMELSANVKMLQGFIQKLKELDKAIMLLYLEENSYEEIGDILGISTSNVGTKIGRIKVKIKKEFDKIKRHGR